MTDAASSPDRDDRGLSRRRVLISGAATTAAVWAAPSLTSVGRALATTGSEGPIGDCDPCADGAPDPLGLVFRYTGDNCGEGPGNDQGDKAMCEDAAGGPDGAPSVRIVASDEKMDKVLFDGPVALGDTWEAAAENAGMDKLVKDLYIRVYAPTGELVQVATLHTSCSQPLRIGDGFGANTLVGARCEAIAGGGTDLCDGDVLALRVTYNGENCQIPAQHAQEDKASCEDRNGGPSAAPTVHVLSQKDDSEVYFDGLVNLGQSFDIAVPEGVDKLDKELAVVISSADRSTVLQVLEIHTSCSAPIRQGDRFGALTIEGLTNDA